jgi:hypothetical protein
MRSAYNVRLASAVAAPCRRIHLSYIQVSIAWGNHASPSNGKLSSLPEFGIKLLAPELESGSPEPGAPAIGNVKGSHGISIMRTTFRSIIAGGCLDGSIINKPSIAVEMKRSHHHLQSSFHRVLKLQRTLRPLMKTFQGLQGAHSSVVKSKRCHQ